MGRLIRLIPKRSPRLTQRLRFKNLLGSLVVVEYMNVFSSKHFLPVFTRITHCGWSTTANYNPDHISVCTTRTLISVDFVLLFCRYKTTKSFADRNTIDRIYAFSIRRKTHEKKQKIRTSIHQTNIVQQWLPANRCKSFPTANLS